MADEKNPTWAVVWDLGIKTLGIAGVIVLYATHGCEFDQTTRSLAKLELDVKNEAIRSSQLQSDLTSFIKDQRAAETRLASAEESQIQRELASRVVVSPLLEQSPLGESLRQISLVLTIENIGNESAKIGGADVDVYRGTFSSKATGVMQKANELLQIEQRMATVLPEDRQALQAEWEKLHADCPHGKIYLVDEAVGEFSWYETVKLQKPADYELGPGQSVAAEFDLMSTHFYGHPIWLRFDPFVNIDGKRQGFGQLTVPIQPSGRHVTTEYTVAKVIPAGSSTKMVLEARDRQLATWEPATVPHTVPILPSTSSNAVRVAD